MTVFLLRSGDLILHSPIKLEGDALAELEALGKVRVIVAPNCWHHLDIPWYAERYPDARVLVPRGAVDKFEGRFRISGTLDEDWTPDLRSEVDLLLVDGTKLYEFVFFHASTRTLVVTDLCFHFDDRATGLLKGFQKLVDVYDRFGPSRVFKLIFMEDRKKLRKSVDEILSRWHFDRVILSHGLILNRDGRERFRTAFSFLGDR